MFPKICTGSETGSVVGYAEVPAGSSFSEITVPVSGVSGTKDVYFVFGGAMDMDHWYFS